MTGYPNIPNRVPHISLQLKYPSSNLSVLMADSRCYLAIPSTEPLPEPVAGLPSSARVGVLFLQCRIERLTSLPQPSQLPEI